MKHSVRFQGELPIRLHREDGWYASRCELLGVTSQDKTENSARKNLRDALLMFFEDCLQMGTPDAVLAGYGFCGISLGGRNVWMCNDRRNLGKPFETLNVRGTGQVARRKLAKPARPAIRQFPTDQPFWIEADPHVRAPAA